MLHDPALLDVLENFETAQWQGRVFRHMLGSSPPERANLGGARWNPRDVPALYVSVTEETAVAEGDHLISLQSPTPRAPRTIYELEISIANLLDLTDGSRLDALDLAGDKLGAIPFEHCQQIGGAIAWLGHDGLLVPSARHKGGRNLVIYTANQPPAAEITTCGKRLLSAS